MGDVTWLELEYLWVGDFLTLVFGGYSKFEKWLGGDPRKTNYKGVIRIVNIDRI